MKYREGNFDDPEQLQKLALISYGQFQNILTEENWDKLRAHITNENLFPGLLKTSKCFICEHDNEIVGMAFLFPTETQQRSFKTIGVISGWWEFIQILDAKGLEKR